MSFRRIPHAGGFSLAAIAAVVSIGASLSACDDSPGPPAATPTATATQGPPPTPTPVPADPAVAARLRYEGETEAAIDVYAAVVEQRDGEVQQEARVALGQLQFGAGRHAEAAATLGAYLTEAPSQEAASPAAFLRASALAERDDLAGALAAYDAYIAAGTGSLTPLARAERARVLARLGRLDEASLAAEQALADRAASPAGTALVDEGVLYDMGEAFEQAGADADALDWYGRAVRAYGSPGGLARRGAIMRRLGDPAWVGEYQSLLKTNPGSSDALDALQALGDAGAPVSAFTRGFALYRNYRNADARAAFTQAIADNDAAGQALYYLGALDERAGNTDDAILHYAESHAVAPDSPVADDALWWRGKLLEQSKHYTDARDVFTTLANDYPASEFAADAGFHAGLALYRDGDETGAAKDWARAAAASSGHERARAIFWQARADANGRNALLRSLGAEFPGDFYALRGEVLLGEQETSTATPDFSLPVDWDAIGRYITAATGVDPLATTTAASVIDERVQPAHDLEEAGRHAQSDALYRAIITDRERDPYALYWLARTTAQEGNVSIASRAATTLLASLPATAPAAPGDLLRAAYPPAYADLVLDAAKEQKIDPLLLMALMRQESFYDARAGSTAGALGLTQVIEPTGEAIAQDLGIDDFTIDDLFRPRLSLRFGASYLADQIATFDGNAYHAIAAYNGGPGTSSNAIDAAGDDVDLFAEDLEFTETQLYVRLVMEHYAHYRQAYLGLSHPSLPQ